MIDNEHSRAWIAELRTTDKRQARGNLCKREEGSPTKSEPLTPWGYCCLGVFAEQQGALVQHGHYRRAILVRPGSAIGWQTTNLTIELKDLLGMTPDDEHWCVVMNDDARWDFRKIADVLELALEQHSGSVRKAYDAVLRGKASS